MPYKHNVLSAATGSYYPWHHINVSEIRDEVGHHSRVSRVSLEVIFSETMIGCGISDITSSLPFELPVCEAEPPNDLRAFCGRAR